MTRRPWATPALRHLILVDGLDPDEALAKIEEFYEMIPDTSFSDRLSAGNVSELLRTDAYTARKAAEGNLGQERPDESTEKFAKVKAYCDRIGFVFADPSTWHVLQGRKHFPFDISGVDFSLTFEEKLAIKERGAALLKCDTPSVYQAAHRVKAFVTKYPGKELPASLVPHLCANLPIFWYVPSDQGTRCKKAEKFLKLLCSLGIIKVVKRKQWFGAGHADWSSPRKVDTGLRVIPLVRTPPGRRTPARSDDVGHCRRPRCTRRSPPAPPPAWRSPHRGPIPSSARRKSSPSARCPSSPPGGSCCT